MEDIINNNLTDKNTTHSYLPVYNDLFHRKKDTATHILEIGVQDGGSIKLWKDYFCNAHVHGVDIRQEIPDIFKGSHSRVTLHMMADAYSDTFIDTLKDLRFDVIIDDGPHTLESMKKFVVEYSKLLKDDGILIVEDVQRIEWCVALKIVTPEHLKKNVKVYDLRLNKGRYDDVLFVIQK